MVIDNEIRISKSDIDIGDIVSYRGDVCIVAFDTSADCFILVALEGIQEFEVITAYETLSDIVDDPCVEFLAYSTQVRLLKL